MTTTAPVSTGAFRRWSFRFDHCQSCGTTETKHKGRGLCLTCYLADPLTKARVARTRKRRALSMDAEASARIDAYKAAWVARNRDRVNATYRAWDKRTQSRRKFPVGSSCFYDMGGVRIPCVVVKTKGYRVKIRLNDGEVVKTAAQFLRSTGNDYGDVL
jgi:hypothetical protein